MSSVAGGSQTGRYGSSKDNVWWNRVWAEGVWIWAGGEACLQLIASDHTIYWMSPQPKRHLQHPRVAKRECQIRALNHKTRNGYEDSVRNGLAVSCLFNGTLSNTNSKGYSHPWESNTLSSWSFPSFMAVVFQHFSFAYPKIYFLFSFVLQSC
jgi:hypothetical protein